MCLVAAGHPYPSDFYDLKYDRFVYLVEHFPEELSIRPAWRSRKIS